MPIAGKFERQWIRVQEWALRRMEHLGTRRKRGPATAPHLEVGLRGERAAMFELQRRGYTVVARRWTSTRMRGDVDLIAWDNDQLCFVEVKTRTAHDMSPAELAVDEDKRSQDGARGLARAYLRAFPEAARNTIGVRFDVVSVYLIAETREFQLFPAAFGWR